MKKLFYFAAAALIAVSCGQANKKEMKSGIQLENLDTTARVGTDFYQYACGGWMKNNPLTGEFSRYGTFDKLNENNEKQLNELIGELAAKKYDAPGVAQKIGDLYNLVMDSTRRNQLGYSPIKPLLDKVAAIKDKSEIIPLMCNLRLSGISGYFAAAIGADMMNSKNNIVELYQDGLSLGEKEYYLNNDEATKKTREQFKEHVVKMFRLCGFDEATAKKNMEAVMEIETRIAGPTYNNVQQRDPAANYHKMTLAQLKKEIPGIDWDVYFNTLEIKGLKELSVAQPEPIKEAVQIINTVPLDKQIAFLQWNVISESASSLSDEIEKEDFNFFSGVMRGAKEQKPRWKRAVNCVSGVLSEAVGEMYVAKYFPPQAKERMLQLVKNLQTALGERIDAQEWMSDSTKAKAHEKLNAFYVKIGYPDKWKDYTKLTIDPKKSLAENMSAISLFFWRDMIDRKYNKPVDKTEWHMPPQMVNAYYNPTTNEICFPAGILQYPFFDMEADDAFNYGAIGVVIGHEMTHGFDDQGSQFDKEGNFNNWWTQKDAQDFKARCQVMADYFNHIEVLPGLHANGALTLGENIADHGGLMISYQAFKNATKEKPLPTKDGFTPEQRFFLAFANVWAGNIREEAMREQTMSNEHSLGRWRVNGSLPHIDAWYEAFGITDKDPMYLPKDKRVTIW